MNPLRIIPPVATWLAVTTFVCAAAEARRKPASENDLIPPATPLVACDPYFSIWSAGDRLTDVDTTHWTGKPHRLSSLVRIDGTSYRIMGATPASIPALGQTGLSVLPTRTIYTFTGAGVELQLTFMTPSLPEDLEILSRPVTYLTYTFRASDGKTHDVAVYFGASASLTVNTPEQEVTWSDERAGDLAVLKVGSRDQMILGKKGDDLRIDWGYLYLAAPVEATATRAFASPDALAESFAANGLRTVKATFEPPVRSDRLDAGLALKPVRVGAEMVSTWLLLAYDDLYSIEYNHKPLRPYWRRHGWEASDLLKAAARDYDSLVRRCAAFDAELMADLKALGGERYARIAALAYRQCFAAGKFVADDHGQPLQFCKENHSNGCIATSDVFYPMSPQFLLFGPTVAKSFLVPFLNYAVSDRWKFPFAPHDLGTYPKANGQVYGGGERTARNQMPVEESGNLLVLMAAVAQMEGNADFAGHYWNRLEQWAGYLKDKGFDPENQLCTDDFAGHLAHNVNLSAKAICGLGAFAKLCALRGDQAEAATYLGLAQAFARRWVAEAKDGDHYRLAFDRPGTWSQKYNLIWDRILGLNLFPDEVRRTEMDFYLKTQNRYGLPLDNRATYTKLDWVLWTATLTRDKFDFEALVSPVFRFLNETPNRSPMTDWYETISGKRVGFTARPVVGGVFARVLYDRKIWNKYARRDRTRAADWAPMPEYVPPVLLSVVSSGKDRADVAWKFTTDRPGEDWFRPDFEDGSWKTGLAGFGTRQTPGTTVRTVWNTPDIWLRREVTLPKPLPENLALSAHHDEDVVVYVNGVRAGAAGGYNGRHETIPFTPEGKAALQPGRNLLALHCHQTVGGQYIDVGIVEVRPGSK
jgi:Glutaminase A six helical-hairpin domain/Domain of unknown function (DUF5127)/Domain of unknown function (DUF4964)